MTANRAQLDVTEKRRRLLQKMLREAGIASVSPVRIPRRSLDAPPPLSFAQQRLWFLDRLMPGNPFYNIDIAIPIPGQVDLRALERSINLIVDRHEALRTTFREVDGQPVQMIAPTLHIPLERVDLQHLPANKRQAEAERLAILEGQRRFNLASGSLLYAKLITKATADHLLLLTIHHIVADGWSLRVLARELQTIYIACVHQRHHNLPELPIQYADFAVWQRERLQGEAMAKLLGYWRSQLSDLPQLVLITDKMRPAVPSFEGAFVPVSIEKAIGARLKQLSAEEDATPFMLLLTVFAILLMRYTDQVDVVIGSPIAGRTHQEVENLIGFFVNTLVLRIDLSGDPSFRTAVARARTVVLEAFAHQELPFERLVEELQPERELSRNPLFQIIFQLFSALDRDSNGASPTVTAPELQRGTAKFDLRFDLWETAESYQGQLEYSTDLFEHATIERMAQHFCMLLADAVSNPQQSISALALITAEEHHQLLESWNDTQHDYPCNEGISQLFAKQVAQHGNKVAVRYEGDVRSYHQLNRAADNVVARLQMLSVQKQSLVGVFLDRSVEMIVAWLGVVKAGGAYVPLDTSYPPARLLFMIEDSQTSVVITNAALASRLPTMQARILLIDDEAPNPPVDDEPSAPIQLAGDDWAYVMYTSGSTGQPKGVCIPHKAINRLLFNTNYIDLKSGERIAQASNAAFDAATFEVWGALLHGGELVGIAREVALSPHELAATLQREQIDHLFLTTALFNRVVQEAPAAFVSLKTLMVGGSMADPKYFRLCLERGSPQRLLHVYGPTESTTFASYYAVRGVAPDRRSLPIGQPISNTTLFVLDRHRRPTPIGVPGELYIGGDGLALGYFRRPELTVERFIPHPFKLGAYLYATGDRVRWLPDGVIDFIGRFDDQTKVRGFRVEPDEIAAHLVRHEAIQEATVVIQQLAAENAHIVAYVVIEPHYGALMDEAQREEESQALVEQWQTIYDDVIYQRNDGVAWDDPTFNLSGWIDTASGLPIPVAEMREQVEQTVARIAACKGARILEIGCGTGLLLFRLAPHAQHYVGTDFSRAALDFVQRHLAESERLSQVTLHQMQATEIHTFAPDSFDTIVLNSVVQYFPGLDYLFEVLEQAIQLTAPGGAIILGDIRNLALLELFHTTVELTRASATQEIAVLREAVRKRIDEEQELVLDPTFFSALPVRFPQIGEVEIQLKRGEGCNELTKYRYDVILRLRAPEGEAIEAEERYWGRDLNALSDLKSLLATGKLPALRVREIPNARIAAEVQAWSVFNQNGSAATVAEIYQMIAPPAAVMPESLWTLSTEFPYTVRLQWGADSGRSGTLEALFVQQSLADRPVRSAMRRSVLRNTGLENFGSDPLRGRFIRNLMPALQNYLRAHLPDYMIPTRYVRLDILPLTPNGKIDRRALPAPDDSRPTLSHNYVAPANALEWRLAEIWRTILTIDTPGIHDDFFSDLGGHSLLATQVVSRIRTELGVELPLRLMFETPTIAELATHINMLQSNLAEDTQSIAITRQQELVDIDTLSDEEVDAALAELLREQEGNSR